MALRFHRKLIAPAFAVMGLTLACFGQLIQPAPAPAPQDQYSGTITGTVVDVSGALVAGARVTLTTQDRSSGQRHEVLSGNDGQFFFTNIPPGPFQLAITSTGFATQESSGVLHPGESCAIPQITLAVAGAVTDVQVTLTPSEVAEVAEAEIKDEEKQRVLGFIPNFYVTYDPHAVRLNSRQKFELAWKSTVDPINLVIVAGIAGVQQSQNTFSGYGQGGQGYAKRFGAAYADLAAGTFIGGAILPSVLKQDPRYFYKGTGSTRSRVLYALANAVICKGDNGRWQPNYSNVLGDLASGAISNLYYPAQNRNGAGLTIENGMVGIGATAAANVFEEFLMRKLTRNAPHYDSPQH